MTTGALGALQSISLPTATAMWALGSTAFLLGRWSLVRQWDTSGEISANIFPYTIHPEPGPQQRAPGTGSWLIRADDR